MSKEAIIEAYKELLDECVSLTATIAEKNLIIKKYNIERFVSRRDNCYMDREKPDTAGPRKQVGTCGSGKSGSGHAGRPTGSQSFSHVDLEAASEKNPTITLDPLEGLPDDEKNRW